MCGRGCAWQGSVHDRGACMAEGVCVAGGHAWHACPQQILRDTVNERAVRILLECILVLVSIHNGFTTSYHILTSKHFEVELRFLII